VTEVQARTKDNPESKLTITFDKAVLRAGSELSLSGVVERVQLTPMAVAAAESTAHSYNPGLNPGSTTNIAMPSQSSASGGAGQLAASGPTNIRDSDIVARGGAGGKLTVLSSTTKTDLKLKHYATLDVRITHSAE
jgi:hypothetical protein